MSARSPKPVIFISYSHKDEPEHPREGEVQWLTFVRTYLQPAIKHGVFNLWVDRHMIGGSDLDPEIEQHLRSCDIFILLISTNSMGSNYIVDREIAIIRQRQMNGEDVHFYPLLLTPTPDAGLDKVTDKNIRPRDGKPLSSFLYNDRLEQMVEVANEIAKLANAVSWRKEATLPTVFRAPFVHVNGLPETPYERLVGRGPELKRLDEAWDDCNVKIVSLIAEGGAGKSAVVNEWLKRLQIDNYRGAQTVLGWSFYNQGTKAHATPADEFLNWSLEKLEIKAATNSTAAKAEMVSEAMMQRRVLLVLDGIEPMQHGLDTQLGELKDLDLRALLRRFAATPPGKSQGLVVLTSRLPVKDIARWRNDAAPVVDIGRLSEKAGAALLRDNGVWGTQEELEAAAIDFGGHPLGLGLLASFLQETKVGDVRRRDNIRAYFADSDNPRHDHARRVMESYERDWLVGQPVLLAIMGMVGLFDRPATGECLRALRAEPPIAGLTDKISGLDEGGWLRAIVRLREARLLAPPDPDFPEVLDAHVLVRDWFGERLQKLNESTWRDAHSRLYGHLRDTTKEGEEPSLEDLAPLYQAITHGCSAGRHPEALHEVYAERVCRRLADGKLEFYASQVLGALGSELSALSWFFDDPYRSVSSKLSPADQSWVLGDSAFCLRAQGRFSEAIPAQSAALKMAESAGHHTDAAVRASNLSEAQLVLGDVIDAINVAGRAVESADNSGNNFHIVTKRTTQAYALLAAGRFDDAERVFADAEQKEFEPANEHPFLLSWWGYRFCDLLMGKEDWSRAERIALQGLEWAKRRRFVLAIGLDTLVIARSQLGLALKRAEGNLSSGEVRSVGARLDEAVINLRQAANVEHIPRGLLARAAFRRIVGDWDGAAQDLDEVDELAKPAHMRLHICDMALERARLCFSRIKPHEIKGHSSRPAELDVGEWARLTEEARTYVGQARDFIADCHYHRRDQELFELERVLAGGCRFASLPPRV